MYYVVAPWGRRDKYSNATIMSEHSTPEDAYKGRDLLVEVESSIASVAGFYVVDEQRQPVPRPAWD